MESRIQDLIDERVKKNKRLGHLIALMVRTLFVEHCSYNVIMRNDWYGITDSEGFYVLPPVYDSIEFIPYSRSVIVGIDGKYGIYNIFTRKFGYCIQLTEVKIYDKYNSAELIEENQRGLWDILNEKLIIPVKYDDLCVKLNFKYLWTKKGPSYYFIDKDSGMQITPPPVKMAYESEYGMFVQLELNNMVIALNEIGNEDDYLLRKTVVKKHGYLELVNSRYGIHDIVNVYGNIIS